MEELEELDRDPRESRPRRRLLIGRSGSKLVGTAEVAVACGTAVAA